MNTDTSDRDAGELYRVLDLDGEVADHGGESLGTEHGRVTGASGSGSEVEEDLNSPFQRSNEQDDEPARPVAASPLKKKKKHPPMFAAEQEFMIAALEEKLLEFPAPRIASSSSVSPEKKVAKKAPSTIPATTPSDSSEIPSAFEKKRKRVRKPKTPSPKQPRLQKRPKKEMIAELKLPTITPTAQTLIEMLATLNASSTVRDVQKIVDVAGAILDNHPTGGSFDEEIEALLAQEKEWKQMAAQSDMSLKEDVKKFFERYGIIPMGALEAAESKAMER